MTRGYDELTQAVRLNDAMSDAHGIEETIRGFGLDEEALMHVVSQRTMRLEAALHRRSILNGGQFQQAVLGSAWMDGFFAALHLLEQEEQDD